MTQKILRTRSTNQVVYIQNPLVNSPASITKVPKLEHAGFRPGKILD